MNSVPPSSEPAGDITLLFQQVEAGDAAAAARILPLVYNELRRLAAAKMAREPPGNTLQPTALVHEAWLKLGGESQPNWKNRAHFFAAAAEGMRRILIDAARRRRAVRHGGELERVSVDSTEVEMTTPDLDDEQLIRLDEALVRLAEHDQRKAEVVKHHYFVGLTLDETAEVMGISNRTTHRDWAYARVWLFNEIKAMQAGEQDRR